MKNTFKNQILAALFAAMIGVLTLISIPTPSGIPVTFQTFAVALSGSILGRKYGFEAVMIWLSLGALGLPVFSGMTGGLGQIIGVTGGFLIGFIPMVILCGTEKSHVINICLSMSGLLICHIFGSIWFSFVSETKLTAAFLTASIPYLPKDILSVSAAYGISAIIKKRLKLNGVGSF